MRFRILATTLALDRRSSLRPGRAGPTMRMLHRFAFASALAGALLLVCSLPGSAADPKTGTFLGPAVTVTKSEKRCFTDSIDITGRLVPREEILVRPENQGYQITHVLVEVGDAVTSGQSLARLSPPEGQSGGTVVVESPAQGVVGNVSAVVGTLTSFQAPPLFQIIAKGELELQADVSTKLISQLSPGQSARVTVVGIGVVPGRVRLVSPTVDAATQLGSTRIFLGNDKRLRVGTFGRASIVAGESCGIAVPLSAVLYGTIGAIVEVVRDNRIETRKVVLGLLSAGIVEIREGLSEGDMVVSRAGSFLREGDHVRPVVADDSENKD